MWNIYIYYEIQNIHNVTECNSTGSEHVLVMRKIKTKKKITSSWQFTQFTMNEQIENLNKFGQNIQWLPYDFFFYRSKNFT